MHHGILKAMLSSNNGDGIPALVFPSTKTKAALAADRRLVIDQIDPSFYIYCCMIMCRSI